MARRKTHYTLDEEYKLLVEQIDSTEQSLSEMKTKKKELEEQIKQQKLEEIYTMIQEKGMDLDQVKELIENTTIETTE